ncbi:hypothetical protein [Accumulibacter sp.]|uniref:hypothetical protein n=1 Tax=Accumulibacter sp. TaxID=2053492 RepID=UPI002605C790|nr:hypothetical protein [Accumulibacter sp.]
MPDTLQGALILSVIDFFLSFVIISGIGVVLALFPLLNRWHRTLPSAAATPKTAAREKAGGAGAAAPAPGDDDIAAIAAAVLVAMDGAPHRILQIDPSQRSAGWVNEGRVAHHASHAPKNA